MKKITIFGGGFEEFAVDSFIYLESFDVGSHGVVGVDVGGELEYVGGDQVYIYI